MASGLPLEGIRIADFTWVWAGPFATLQLAHLGAEVIRVETTTRVCVTRRIPPFADGQAGPNRSGYYNQYNQGKASICLNLKNPEAREVAKKLVAVSDVVAENFAAGVMDKMGLGYEALKRVKPDIIMIAMSGYGASGPESSYVSYGPAQVPMSGLSSLTGFPGFPPMHVGFSYGDPNGGLHGAFAVLAALMHRARTGEGQFIDLSQWETSVVILGEGLMDQVMNGTQPPRMGNRDPHMAPHGLFRCQGEDRWVSIAVANDHEWQRLCEGMGQPHLAADPRFATLAARKRHEDELEALVSAWAETLTAEEMTRRLQAVGVAAFPALTNKELAEDPHLETRGYFVELPHPEVGVRRHAGVPWVFSDTPCQVRRPAPLLGQDTDDVMQRVLGYSAEEVEGLKARGVLL
ncbi:MAG: CoA transferase [Thermodesulfobacteriota bacterium]|jgi:crotonobetainyl-CoA:carnitine CoA-transferase CaiB-like acyl-CoA transferase